MPTAPAPPAPPAPDDRDQLDLFGAPAPAAKRPSDVDSTAEAGGDAGGGDLFAVPEALAHLAHQRRREVVAANVPTALRQTASALPADIRLGTSSWTFPGWEGLVYESAPGHGRIDRPRLVRDGLAAYAEHPLLRCVGVDRTWHAPLNASAFANYAAQTPAGFRFLVKAHALTTLPNTAPNTLSKGRADGPANPFFLDATYAEDVVVQPFVEGLRRSAGPLLFQFSPLGRAFTADPAAFAARLARFLGALPRGPLYAVELRDKALFNHDYLDALADAGAVHCYTGHPTMPAIKSQVGTVAAHAARQGDAPARAVVARWSLCRGMRYAQARAQYSPFNRVAAPDPGVRETLLRLCLDAHGAGRESYVIFNNKAEGCAPGSAFAMAELLVDGLAER